MKLGLIEITLSLTFRTICPRESINKTDATTVVITGVFCRCLCHFSSQPLS